MRSASEWPFHDEHRPVLVFQDVVDAASVWMRDLRGRACLLPEALAARRVGVEFANHRQRDDSLEAPVLRFVDHTHAAFANFRENTIRPDALRNFRHSGCWFDSA